MASASPVERSCGMGLGAPKLDFSAHCKTRSGAAKAIYRRRTQRRRASVHVPVVSEALCERLALVVSEHLGRVVGQDARTATRDGAVASELVREDLLERPAVHVLG